MEKDYYERYPFRMAYMRSTLVMGTIIWLLIIAFFFVWPPIKRILEAKHEIMRAQASGLKLLPVLESRIAILEKQTGALTTENIESRLTTIETAIKVGEVRPENLSSLQDLRNDFEKMKTFLFAQPDQLVEFRTLQKDYQELKLAIEKIMDKDDILRNIDSVRHLFYATLAGCGILVSIFAGAWFVAFRQRLKIEPASIPKARAPKEKRDTDGDDST